MATQFSLETIKKAYITFYGRPADDKGLQYWAERLDEAGTSGMNDVIEEFGDSTEFTERYSENSNTDLINNIYQQAFSRDADDEGLAFYVERLESGEASLANIALQIMNSAQGDDALVLQKKIEVGDLLVIQAQEEGRVYTGSAVATAVSELLSEVTLDSPSAQEHVTAFNDITDRMAYSQNSYQPEALEEGYQKREELDVDRDGFVENVKISTYDAQDRLIRTDEDTDGDGNSDKIFQWQYDEFGHLTRSEADTDGDGNADQISQWQFDEFGNLSRHEVDTNGNGQADYIATSVYKDTSGIEAIEAYQLQLTNYHEAFDAYASFWGTSHEDLDPGNIILEQVFVVVNLPAEEKTEAYHEAYQAYKEAYDTLQEIRQAVTTEYKNFYLSQNDYNPSDAPESPSEFIPENTSYNVILLDDNGDSNNLDRVNLVNQTIDSNGDGQADYTLNYEYDVYGRLLNHQQDSDGDGQADYSLSYVYDELGRLLNQQQDNDGDGQADFAVSYQYRDSADMADDIASSHIDLSELPIASNELTRREIDHNGDGQADDIVTYQYNEQGWITRYDHDTDGDGQLNISINYGYDDLGRVALRESDNDGDGLIDKIERIEFDTTGNKIRHEEERDNDGDGVSDALSINIWDAAGNNTLSQSDTDLDGVFDLTTTREFDALGNQTLDKDNSSTHYYTYDDQSRVTSQRSDWNGDGIIDGAHYNEYNDQGELIRQDFDENGDGIIDSFSAEITTIEGNITRIEKYGKSGLYRSEEQEREDGILVRVSKDSDGDGDFDEETFYSYDENGNSTRNSVDSNGDGIIDLESYFIHDENDNLLFSKHDLDLDGIMDSVSSYTYDADGNRTSHKREFDYNDDGQIDYSQTSQYNNDGKAVLIGTYGSRDIETITVSDSETIYFF